MATSNPGLGPFPMKHDTAIGKIVRHSSVPDIRVVPPPSPPPQLETSAVRVPSPSPSSPDLTKRKIASYVNKVNAAITENRLHLIEELKKTEDGAKHMSSPKMTLQQLLTVPSMLTPRTSQSGLSHTIDAADILSETEHSSMEELRNFLFHIIEMKQSTETCVEQIIALFINFEIPNGLSAVDFGHRGERLGKDLVMKRYLSGHSAKSVGTRARADSGFESCPWDVDVPHQDDQTPWNLSPHSTTEPFHQRGVPVDDSCPIEYIAKARSRETSTERFPAMDIEVDGAGAPRDTSAAPESACSPKTIESREQRQEMEEEELTPTPPASSNLEEWTSEVSQTMEVGNVVKLILGKKKAELMEKHLQRFFCNLIDNRLGIRTINGEDTQGSDAVHDPGTASTMSGAQVSLKQDLRECPRNSRNRKKRGRDDGSEEEDGDEELPKTKRNKVDMVEKQKMACPFIKRHPVEFSTWRTCPGPGFDGLHRMKEHLKRRHFHEHVCQRCGRDFKDVRTLQSHLREPIPCLVDTSTQKMGFITQIQWDEISRARKGNGVSVIDVWKQIFHTLFPEVEQSLIPSPFFEHSEFQSALTNAIDPIEYEAYLADHLPRRILEKLNQELQFFSEQVKIRLADIVREEALETLKSFMLQKGANPESVMTSSTQTYLEPGTWGLEMLDRINMFGDLEAGEELTAFPFASGWLLNESKEAADSAYGSNQTAG